MKRPKDLADRSRELRDVSGFGSDGSLREKADKITMNG
jgi:hypothetical protein